MTERDVARDLPEPSSQPLRLAQFVNLPPGRQERLLPGVLAGREVPEDSERDAAHHR